MAKISRVHGGFIVTCLPRSYNNVMVAYGRAPADLDRRGLIYNHNLNASNSLPAVLQPTFC